MNNGCRSLTGMFYIGLIVLLIQGNAFAWSEGGHKVVALIAWERLDPATRTKVADLLKSHPRWKRDFAGEMPDGMSTSDQERWLFAQAAIWPDMARDLPQYHHQSWHFINLPIFVNKASKDALKVPTRFPLKWTQRSEENGTQNACQTVDLAIRTLTDSTAPRRDKALMLSWLIHVVGDLHQPLHTTAYFSQRELRRGDHGGNSIELLRSAAEKKPQTLHSFWDHLHGGQVDLAAASSRVGAILSEPKVTMKAQTAGTNMALQAWIMEGWTNSSKYVYGPAISNAVAKADSTFEDERDIEVVMPPGEYQVYAQQAEKIAIERAAIGGYRLAAVLKSAVK